MAEQVKTKKKHLPFYSGIELSPGPSAEGLRALADKYHKSEHPERFMDEMQELIDSGHLRFQTLRDIRPFWDALSDAPARIFMPTTDGRKKSIDTTAFPLLIGGMMQAEMVDQYESIELVGDQLVEDMPTSNRVTMLARIDNYDPNSVTEVAEGEPFPEMKSSSEGTLVTTNRNGRKISLTQEVIEENRIPEFIGLINGLTDWALKTVNRGTIEAVIDVTGSGSAPAAPYVYAPKGVGTSLYQTSNSTLKRLGASGNRLQNTALQDVSDLEAARALLDACTDSMGFEIENPVNDCILLVPGTLGSTARTLRNSILTPSVTNEVNDWGPQGAYQPRVLSTASLNRYSTTAWYLGRFRKQFKRLWRIEMEYMTLGMTTQEYLNRRIGWQGRICFAYGVGAVDYPYVVQALSGTTPPSKP